MGVMGGQDFTLSKFQAFALSEDIFPFPRLRADSVSLSAAMPIVSEETLL